MKWTDGFLARGTGEYQEVYISRNRAKYADTINDSYVDMGHDTSDNGYVKYILALQQSLPQEKRVYGDLFGTDVSGSSSTFFCDYHYTAHEDGTIYGGLLGGNAVDGANGGLAYVISASTPALADAYIGSRLVWQK